MPNVIGQRSDGARADQRRAAPRARPSRAAAWCARRSPRSRTRCSTSRARRWACRSTSCSAASCATASRSTGRIAAPTACATPTLVGEPAVRTYDDMTKVGAEVKAKGFRCAQDQHRDRDRRQDHRLSAGLRGRPRLSRAQLGRLHRAQRGQDGRGLPQGLRARCRHHARHQLPFPHRGLPAHRRGGRADRAHLARARCARSEVDRPDPPRFAVPDRLGRDAARAPRLPAVFRGLCLRHRDRRRGVERLLRIAEDRGDGRRLRGERGAAQFLRPSRDRPSARISAPPCRTSASWRSTSTA